MVLLTRGTDYYAWTQLVVEMLRNDAPLDRETKLALAEEIEDLGKAERRALEGAVEQLFLHLLKKQYQPAGSGRSCDSSIRKQQRSLAKLVRDSPSVDRLLKDPTFLQEQYEGSVLGAMQETGLPEEEFPAVCPYDYRAFEFPSLPIYVFPSTKERKR